LDLSAESEQGGKEDGIEGAPGKEGMSLHPELVLGWHKRYSPPNNLALFVKFGICNAGEVSHDVFVAHV